MAYDEALTNRVRGALEGLAEATEKRMMGGVCFLLNGNMIGGAHRDKAGAAHFMFRVGKENEAAALARPGARILDLNGRRMGGMISVDADACDDAALKDWLAFTLTFTRSLPPKPAKPPKKARPRG